MEKKLLILAVFLAFLTNCGDNSAKEKELELRERELMLKEQQLGINDENSTNQQSTHNPPRKKTEKELKIELYNSECSRPTELLSGSMNITPVYKNALSLKVKGLKIKCEISNQATLATFKDIKAIAKFTSKTGSTILTKEFSVYEFIAPKNSITYKNKFDITNREYKDISKFSWTILDASCRK